MPVCTSRPPQHCPCPEAATIPASAGQSGGPLEAQSVLPLKLALAAATAVAVLCMIAATRQS
ncbi:uncharacterized protein CC84DRAFT_1159870 [Paraphaeosphaeria sporulosa]|uniref:Uncharacterized protein n=1 Tax=Paraphaeosphaeria sporulosa TaxID=1460663 RepID=A0A177CZN1_9PLEO|nr:uncharacterized protein CC84DRAFT_1159870 [Paraphaeosphaeria sporulosa]OAG12581.1 hypothetical protein CC84DRAFT_1159870 [Paraphaeosphaeria sporulosa]